MSQLTFDKNSAVNMTTKSLTVDKCTHGDLTQMVSSRLRISITFASYCFSYRFTNVYTSVCLVQAFQRRGLLGPIGCYFLLTL